MSMSQESLDQLIALRELAEAGCTIRAVDARNIWPELSIWQMVCAAANAGSVDAASKLQMQLVPNWRVSSIGKRVAGYVCWLAKDNAKEVWAEGCDTQSRAWLLAIFSALIADAQEEHTNASDA